MAGATEWQGKRVFVVGGSKGLGKEMGKVMAAQGAHITVFARNQEYLSEAKDELLASRLDKSQEITVVQADMGKPSTARAAIAAQPHLPDVFYCVAGGTPTECGFLIDLEPEVFERCMNNNYYSSLYPAQAVLKLWVEDDKTAASPSTPKVRRMIFVNSSAALIPVPGYVAYSAPKAAQRALADTMRLEAMRYSGPVSKYIVQCIFAHNYITETFLVEQKTKPELCKRIEGTSSTELSELEKHFPYASKIAPEIVANVLSNDFAVMDKRMDPQALWANMIGTSPKRGWGIVDSLLALLTGFLLIPRIRRDMERKCLGDALRDDDKTK